MEQDGVWVVRVMDWHAAALQIRSEWEHHGMGVLINPCS